MALRALVRESGTRRPARGGSAAGLSARLPRAAPACRRYSGEWKEDPDQTTFLTVPITPDLPPQPIITAAEGSQPTPHVIFT